jgi:hypothetical protein
MVDTPKDKGQTESEQDLSLRLRRQLSNAYASILGEQTAKDFSAFTFEEAVDAQIERIEGEDTEMRPNLRNRVLKIKNETLKAVEEIKNMPPEAFIEKKEDEDANTKLNDEEQAAYDQYLAESIEERERVQ